MNCMWQSLAINRNVTLDARYFLSLRLAFFFCRIRVFHALKINDEKTGGNAPTIASSLPKPTDFFKAFFKEAIHLNAMSIGSFALALTEIKIAMLHQFPKKFNITALEPSDKMLLCAKDNVRNATLVGMNTQVKFINRMLSDASSDYAAQQSINLFTMANTIHWLLTTDEDEQKFGGNEAY